MSDEKKTGNCNVKVVREIIMDMDVECWVYYATEDLKIGTGFGTAIQQMGGPSIQKELDEMGGINTTEAVLTGAGEMKAQYLIHAAGPKFQEDDTESKLRMTMENTLKIAHDKGIKQIAFPAMGYGFYGVPLPMVTKVMMGAIADHAKKETSISDVFLVANDSTQHTAFKEALTQLV